MEPDLFAQANSWWFDTVTLGQMPVLRAISEVSKSSEEERNVVSRVCAQIVTLYVCECVRVD